jgi:methylmalonyl-CoA/ethylmalonyl-CoA epimerase
MNRTINHIALLVPSAEKAADVARRAGFSVGPTEDFEGEGTREIYVGGFDHDTTLLLMEPINDGAYSRAMAKRGPGLHHIAIDVLNLDEFIAGLSSTGWLLHPKSLHTIKKTQTAFLARPGFPMLVEVQERKSIEAKPLFIQRMALPLGEANAKLLKDLGVEQIVSAGEESWLEFGKVRINLSEFWPTPHNKSR